MFAVVITEKGGAQRRMEFDKSEVTIGRVQGNDIILPKGNVSKRHSRIVLKDSRFIVVLRKPADRFGQTLGTPDEYWVIQRDLAAEARGEGEDAMGPYTANEYAGLAEQNAFPEFTIAFDDLR